MGVDKSNVRWIVHYELPRSIEDYVQGCGRAGRDGLCSDCTTLLGETDHNSLRSQIYGAAPSRDTMSDMVKKIFGPDGYPIKKDTNMYLSFYDISHEFDVSELTIRICLSRLAQDGVLEEKTSVYSQYKVGKISETNLKQWEKEQQPHAADGNTSGSRASASRQNDIMLSMANAILAENNKYPRRKWTMINTLEYANLFGAFPEEIVSSLSSLCRIGVCDADGGVTKVLHRYRILTPELQLEKTDSVPSDQLKYEQKIEDVTELLYRKTKDIKSRGLLRVDEVYSLLKQGATESSSEYIWQRVAEYFEDSVVTSDDASAGDFKFLDDSKFEGLYAEEPSDVNFDNNKWKTFRDLVENGVLPKDDELLLARFATGVISPKIMRMKLSRNEHFGMFADCDWKFILKKCQQF